MLSLLPRELRDLLAQYLQPHLRLDFNDSFHMHLYEPCFSLVCDYKVQQKMDRTARDILSKLPLVIYTEGSVNLCYKSGNLSVQRLGVAYVNFVLTGDGIERAFGCPTKPTLDSYVTEIYVTEIMQDLIYITATIKNSTCDLACKFSYSSRNRMCTISKIGNEIVLRSKEMELTLNPESSSELLARLCEYSNLPESLVNVLNVP